MTALWQCGVCEAVNQGGRTCSACGAAMTLRSAAKTSVRGRLAPVPVPPPPATPLPEPVRRAINREPVPDEEWPYEDNRLRVVPMPGGCLVTSTPRGW
ncbi:MAG: hypothetical protein JWN08_2835 [Frankiales bacterium]|nr:hypothetical protein [Frankiales bacterium]